jgi:3-oxoacyl-[acyl-carrier protein] reductase
MQKKTILITGSSYGIGFEIAKNFANEKFDLIITARNQKKINLAKNKLNFNNVYSYVCDFELNKSVNTLLKKIKNKFKKIDIIICNVGSGKSSKSGEENYDIWRKTFNKNFFTTTNVVENYIKVFNVKNHTTKIIVIGSIAGRFKGNAPLSYSLAKNCLINYVDQISPILAKRKILINAISPGHVFLKGNNWHKKMLKNKNNVLKLINNTISLKRFCSIEDINNCINFLISEKSNYLNGINLEVDGKTK